MCWPVDAIRGLRSRLLLIHGAEDEVISVSHSRSLIRAATRSLSELWVVNGSRHGEAFFKFPRVYKERVAGFFRQHLQPSPSA